MFPFLELWSSKWVQLTEKSKDPMHPETNACRTAEIFIDLDLICACMQLHSFKLRISKDRNVLAHSSQSELTKGRKTPKCTFQNLYSYLMT